MPTSSTSTSGLDTAIVRKSGEGESFWPQIVRVEMGQHPRHPQFKCLVAIIPKPTCHDERQKLVDDLNAAAQEGAPRTTDSRVMQSRHWVIPEPEELVLARIEGDESGGTNDTVVGLAHTAGSLSALTPGAEEKLKVYHLFPGCT